MHLSVASVVLLLGLFLEVQSDDKNETDLVSAHVAVATACNSFSTSLYKAVASAPGNLVMSPMSVETSMALAWTGATGETAKELARGLHLPEDRDVVELGFNFLLSSLESTETITLDLANKLYVQKGYKVKEPFQKSALLSFRSDAEEVNFVNATEEARTSINKWVANKTHDRIQDLVPPGSVSEDTRMLAVNAIYFRGGWMKPFNESETTEELFYTSANTSVNVSMMHQIDYFYHGEIPHLKVQVLKLFYRGSANDESYKDTTKSMVILLPETVEGLADLEANITSLNVSEISNYLSKKQLILSLPKFKVESSLKLVKSLQQLGISKVFSPGAELSGISDEDIYINDVVQKAFIEVTEKGTEAAAATFIELVNFIGSSPTVMNINHPFLYLVMDEPSNTVLFMGRLLQPESSE